MLTFKEEAEEKKKYIWRIGNRTSSLYRLNTSTTPDEYLPSKDITDSTIP